MRTFAVAAVLAAVLTSCSGGDSDSTPTASSTTERTDTTEEATTTTEDPATIRAYVAQIAPAITSWREADDSYLGACMLGGCPPTEALNLLGLRFSSENVKLNVEIAIRDNDPLPVDMAGILDELHEAASVAVDEYKSWDEQGCSLASPPPCSVALRDVEWAFDDVGDAITRWESVT